MNLPTFIVASSWNHIEFPEAQTETMYFVPTLYLCTVFALDNGVPNAEFTLCSKCIDINSTIFKTKDWDELMQYLSDNEESLISLAVQNALYKKETPESDPESNPESDPESNVE